MIVARRRGRPKYGEWGYEQDTEIPVPTSNSESAMERYIELKRLEFYGEWFEYIAEFEEEPICLEDCYIEVYH